MATVATKRWTIADLSDLPDEGRYEVWGGELIEMPASGGRHSSIGVRISMRIATHVESLGLGVILGADGGFVIAREPMTLFVPDVSFVRSERYPVDDAGILVLVPDLVVEVVSQSDRARDVAEKISVYRAAGVALIWVVYPEQRMVAVHTATQPDVIHQFHEGDELDGGDVLPEFRLPVADIFPRRVTSDQ